MGRGVTRPAMCTGMAAGWLGGKRDNEKGWEGEHGGPPVTGGQFTGPTGLSSAAPGFADAGAELDGSSSQGGLLCPEKAHSLHSSVPCPLTAPAPVPPSPPPAGGPQTPDSSPHLPLALSCDSRFLPTPPPPNRSTRKLDIQPHPRPPSEAPPSWFCLSRPSFWPQLFRPSHALPSDST